MPRATIYTTDHCPYCDKAKRTLGSRGIEYEEINIHGDPKIRDEIESFIGRRDVPQIFLDDQYLGDDDALEELAQSGRLDEMFGNEAETTTEAEERDVIIVGAGPAGYAAALYAARARLEPLLLTGAEIGGQLSLTSDIENYPGFGGSEAGELIRVMQQQAENFGTEFRMQTVTEVNFRSHPFLLKTHEAEYHAKSVVICTGSSPRKLGIPGELEYVGTGISYCATCDGFFFQDRPIVVVGGGDAAIEEALFLTRFASEIHLVHRRDRLRASQVLQERALKSDKIKFIWDTVPEEIVGEDGKGVTGIRLRNVKTNEEVVHPTDGVFIFIGHLPNTDIYQGQIEMDEKNYIITDKLQRTNIPGVFAAGDVQDHIFRQAITAAGTGAAAGIEAEKFVAELENRAYPGHQ